MKFQQELKKLRKGFCDGIFRFFCFLSLIWVLFGMTAAAQHSWLTQHTAEKGTFGLQNTTNF